MWAGIVHGFAGMVETGELLSFAPRLPSCWSSVRFRVHRHGSTMEVELTPEGCTLRHVDGVGVPVRDGDARVVVHAGVVHRIPRFSTSDA